MIDCLSHRITCPSGRCGRNGRWADPDLSCRDVDILRDENIRSDIDVRDDIMILGADLDDGGWDRNRASRSRSRLVGRNTDNGGGRPDSVIIGHRHWVTGCDGHILCSNIRSGLDFSTRRPVRDSLKFGSCLQIGYSGRIGNCGEVGTDNRGWNGI
jgi:hypothetical protein